MGLKMKRLKGGSKGHKWKKGQSCVSNPTSTKFRAIANQGFFKKIENRSLTADAVAQHENVLGGTGIASGAPSLRSVARSDIASMLAPSSTQLSIAFTPPTDQAINRTVTDLQREMEQMCVDENDDLRSQARTFASRFSTCSIPAFEKLFDNFDMTSEHHQAMLAHHAIVQQQITQYNLPEDCSSYFVATIMSLQYLLDDAVQVAAGLGLVARVIQRVPMRMLREKCTTFGAVLDTVLMEYKNSENIRLVTHVLACMSILLRAQHLASWYKDNQLKTWLKNILVFTMHEQPRIRKCGQYNVSAVLKGSQFMVTSPLRSLSETDVMATTKMDDEQQDDDDTEQQDQDGSEQEMKQAKTTSSSSNGAEQSQCLEVHPAADMVADFLIGQLKANRNMETVKKSALHMLVFTRQVIMAMPKHKLQVVVRQLFDLVSLGNGLVNRGCMQALHALCDASPPAAVLPQQLLHSLLNTLTKHTPGMSSAIIAAPHDPVAVKAWSDVVSAAVRHAIRLDAAAGIKWCSEWCKVALQYWRSDNNVVHTAMEESVSAVLDTAFDAVNNESCETHVDGVRAVMQHLEKGLSYQCQGAWRCVFRLIGQCYSVLGQNFAPQMMPSLTTLCEQMADSSGHDSVGDLEKAIGKAVQGLGAEAVECCAPVRITGNLAEDERNLWLLPMLRKWVRGSRLVFYNDKFIPLAHKCFEHIRKLERNKDANPRELATYKTIEYQIWAMLPSFANQAKDVDESQKNKEFAQLICRKVEHSDDSRIDILAAIRHMVKADGTSTGRLAFNGNNYIPVLFNLFLKEPKTAKNAMKDNVIDNSHRLATLETIMVYLKIVPQTQCHKFMDHILEKYSSEVLHTKKRGLLHLARAFVPFVGAKYIEAIYDLIVPLINNTKNGRGQKAPNIKNAKIKRDQKAAYRVLEDMLGKDSEGATEFINDELLKLSELLLKSVYKAAASSRAPRLRCATVVLNKISERTESAVCEEFLNNAVSETVMCCGRTNSVATRKAAFFLLAALPEAMRKLKHGNEDATVRECVRLLSGGLLGRPSMQANTIIAITAYTYQSRDFMPIDILKQNVVNICALMSIPSREGVQSCLSFIKGVVALYPTAILGPLVKTIIDGILSLTPDCARKYRQKTKSILARLMRKFGDDYICKMVPAKHVTLHKRLRNLRKEASRTRRQREAEDQQYEEADGRSSQELFADKPAPTTLEEILAEIDPELQEEEDDEGGRKEGSSKRRQKNKPTAAWIAECDDSDEDILDFQGPNAAQAIMSKKPAPVRTPRAASKYEQEDNGFCVDPVTGKLLIVDDAKEDRKANAINELDQDELDDALHMRAAAMSGKVTKRRRDDDGDSDASIDIPLPKRAKKKNFDYGAEFRSKKARGDVMKKGQTQKPFAYVQLSKDRLNKRKQAKYEGQFKMVVKGTKKGVRQGSKLRKSEKNN